jgi:C_GCAxxG_C_C family probable redox protein
LNGFHSLFFQKQGRTPGNLTMNEKAAQRSQELFKSGYYCAESVLLALAESKGIQSDMIPRIATGFCSGISLTGGMCGAISGGIMGISLMTGRSSPGGSIELCYALTQQLISRFEMQHGSTSCRQLIDCNLATEEGQRTFVENHLIDRCLEYAGDATRIVMSLIPE